MPDIVSVGIKVDTSDVRKGTIDLKRLSSAEIDVIRQNKDLKNTFNQTADSSRKLGNENKKTADKTRSLSSSFGSLRSAMGALGIAVVTRKLFTTTAVVQDLETRIRSLTKESNDYAATQAFIVNAADRQHKSIVSLTDGYSKLRVLQNSGVITGNQTKDMLTGINDAASTLGASDAQLKQVFFGLAQGLASSKLKAEEMNQVMEPLPGLMQSMDKAVSKSGNVVAGEFRRMVLSQQVTSQMFAETLVKALGDFEGAAERTGNNVNAKLTDIENAWTKLVIAVNKEGTVPGLFTTILDSVAVTLNALADFDTFFFSTMSIADKFRITLSTGFQTIVLEVQASFKSMVQSALETLASFTSNLAKAASFVGLDSFSDGLNRFAISVTPGISAADELKEKLKQLGAEALKEKAAIDANVVSYIAFNNKLKQNNVLKSGQNSDSGSTNNSEGTGAIKASKEALAERNKEAQKWLQYTESMREPLEIFIDEQARLKEALDDEFITLETYNRGLEKLNENLNKPYQVDIKLKDKKLKKELKDVEKDFSDLDKKLNSFGGFDYFGGLAGDVSQIGNAFEDMNASLAENQQNIELNASAWAEYIKTTKDFGADRAENIERFEKRSQQLSAETTQIRLDGIGDMTQGMSNMFNSIADMQEEGSQKQKSYQKAALIAEAAGAVVKGVSAVLNALQGDPYTAIPRAVITAGIVAAQLSQIGQSYSAVSGGGGAPARQESQGKGSVLGDPDQVSKSLGNSLEDLEEMADIGLTHTNKMIVSLQNIDNNTKALAIGISQNEGFSDFKENASQYIVSREDQSTLATDYGAMQKKWLDFLDIGGLFGGVIDWAFGSKQKTTDAGIQFNSDQTVGSAYQGGLDSSYFAEIETTQKLFGISIGTETATATREIDDEVAQWFSSISMNVADSVLQGATVLKDESLGQLQEKLFSQTLGLDDLSLYGLDIAESEEAISGVFSKMADNLVEELVPELANFQQVGEGMFETLTRVSSQVELANVSLYKFGFEAINYTDVIKKQGDVGAEIVRQTIVMNDKYSAVSDIMKTVSGDTGELIKTYEQLSEAQRFLVDTGLGENTLDAVLIGASGGINNLNSNLESYFEDFNPDITKFNLNLADMRSNFTDMNLIMPDNKAQFVSLIDGIDTTSDEGKILLARLLELAPAVSELSDEFDKLDFAKLNNFFQDGFKLLNFKGPADANKISEVFGGTDVAQAKWGRFFDHFYDDIDVAENNYVESNKRINEKINSLGITGLTQDNFAASFVAMLDKGILTAENQNIGLDVANMIADNSDLGEQYSKLLADQFSELIDLQESKYDKELEYIDKISDYLDSLLLDDNLSPLTNGQKLTESRGQFSTQLSLAKSGDADALSGITDISRKYLEQARNYFSSGDEYNEIFANVTGSLAGLRDEIDAQITEDTSTESVSTAVYDQTKALIENSNATTQSILDALHASYTQDQIESYGLGGLIADLEADLNNQTHVLGTTVADGAVIQLREIEEAKIQAAADAEKQRLLQINLSTAISDKQIQEFVDANTNDFRAIYDAADKYGISADRLASNTEFKKEEIQGYTREQNLPELTDRGAAGSAVTDAQIREYIGVEKDLLKVYNAAQEFGLTSSRVAANSEWTREQILAWADEQGLPRFAGGGITTGVSIAGESGAEAVVPIPNGYIEARVTNNDSSEMLAELKALREEVSMMRQDRPVHTQALIDSIYDSSEQATDQVVGVNKEMNDNSRPLQAEVA